MESKVKGLYLLVLDKNFNINTFYRKWKSETTSHFDYYIRSIRDTVKKLNEKDFLDPHISYVDIGKFIEDNIGFGQ